jgi:hypothetical protein
MQPQIISAIIMRLLDMQSRAMFSTQSGSAGSFHLVEDENLRIHRRLERIRFTHIA